MPDISPLVEKFPSCTRAERDALLDFARTTPLYYGAWKPWKQLFKKAEAEQNHPDIELLGVLLSRVDRMDFAQPTTRWKAVDATLSGDKIKSVPGGGFKYSVGPRTSWYDYSGWRLVVEPESSGLVSQLRRALGLIENSDAKTIAFDFEAGAYIYEVKNVKLEGGELQITCGSFWNGRGAQNVEYSFVVDVSDPAFIHLREDGPKLPTRQYMKRRARRILRHLSQKSPDFYPQLAMQFLREHGDKPLNPALNWAAMDVMFAASPRWQQPRSGRGPYTRTAAFVRKRREERAPAIWDAHLELARELWARPDVPIEANEMALKILRAHGESSDTLQVLMRGQLARFLNSDRPLLQSFATRALARLARNGEAFDGAEWARIMLLADARTRRDLLGFRNQDEAWSDKAAQSLGEAFDVLGATRKRRAAALLVDCFSDKIGDEIVWRNLEIFADANPRTRDWLLGRVRLTARGGEFWRLREFARLRPDLRDSLTGVFSEAAFDAVPSVAQALPIVAGNDQDANAAGWRFLAATAMSGEEARELWRRVWDSTDSFASAVRATAAKSAGAMALFERVNFSSEEIEFWLPKLPDFRAALSQTFFAAIFRRLNAPGQIELALEANDEQWSGARAILLQTLQNPEQLGLFWNRVLERVASDDSALVGRIVDDVEISATFTRVPSDRVLDLLERTHPDLEPWLARWLDANIGDLRRGDNALMFAAISPLGEIRRRGLDRVREVGLDLPFALRLMESGLPQPFELAREWFQSNTELDLADRALALCDSPDARVRAFGREFLEANAQHIDAKILKKLSENADPIMQAWLAEHLLKDASGVEVAAFDRAILRTRGRARRAKEAVKKRRAMTQSAPHEYSSEDVATLLDLARSRTSRDRDWALGQLAQAALAGQEIDGVQVRRD